MKIRKVKGEIGTTGNYVDFEITNHPSTDIGGAVEQEHYCDDSTCDIHAALEANCPLTAADLLIGATECPLVEAVIWAHRFNRKLTWNPHNGEVAHDWGRWTVYHMQHGIECPSCNAFNYGNDYWTPEKCENCLHEFAFEEMYE